MTLAEMPRTEVGRKIVAAITAVRGRLVDLGAARAGSLSDAELMAESVQVRWKLSQHRSRGEWWDEDAWIPALAESLRDEKPHG